MTLRDSFRRGTPPPSRSSRATSVAADTAAPTQAKSTVGGSGKPVTTHAFAERSQRLKAHVHRTMIDRINLESLETISPDQLRVQVRAIISSLIAEENIPLGEAQRISLEEQILNETFGLGPIEPFLHDPDVSDILVNTHKQVFVERFGKLELTDAHFDDDDHLRRITDRIVSRVGRRVDESSPMVDARLPDGSRVNAIIPPLALDGPILSIRRFGNNTMSMQNLVALGSLSEDMAEVLQAVVRSRLNTLIVGGTGSGKTTLLNALSAFIPEDERIITIEDAAELQLLQTHVVRLETRPFNIEGKGQVTQRDLVRNALRMRPDRIIVGEVRGPEVLDMLQAMNTGHDGSLTTIHANSAREAMHRLETLMLLVGINLPPAAMREQISAALDVVVNVNRMTDGTRRVVSISEVVRADRKVVGMQDLFCFQRTGSTEDGKILGQFVPTGIQPAFTDRLAMNGIHLRPELFRETEGVRGS